MNKLKNKSLRCEVSSVCEPCVKVFLYADDLITTSYMVHESSSCEPHRATLVETVKNDKAELTGMVVSLSESEDVNDIDQHSEINVISKSSCDASSSCSSSSCSSASCSSSTASSTDPSNPLVSESNERPLPGMFDFDLRYCPQPIIILYLYCIGHYSFYELFSNALYGVIGNIPNQRITFIVLSIFSLLILRITEGLFGFLGDEQYDRFYKDRKARIRLVKSKHLRARSTRDKIKLNIFEMDVGSRKLFKRHKYKKRLLEMFAYYSIAMSVGFMNEQIIPKFSDMTQEIIDGLPSGHHGLVGGVSLIGHRISLNPAYVFPSEIVPAALVRPAANDTLLHYVSVQQVAYDEMYQPNTCVQQVASDLIYQYDHSVYHADNDYLYKKLSRLSYWAYMKDESHKFLRTRNVLLFHAACFMISFFTLAKVYQFSLWSD